MRFLAIIRILMGIFIVCSGIFKIVSPDAFVEAAVLFVPQYGIRMIVVVLLPIFEVVAGMAIVHFYRPKFFFPLLVLALTAGTLYLYSQEVFREAPCGCFGGVIESKVSTGLYIRNVALALLLLLLQMLYLYRDRLTNSQMQERL